MALAPARLLGATLLACGVPAATLLVLLALELVAPLPGLLALLVVVAAGAALAWAWLVSLARVAAALRRAADGGVGQMPAVPPLPAAAELVEAVGRLSRSLQERSVLVERLRRADAAIVETLPDPLLVLSGDRRPLRANRAARTLLGVPGDAADASLPGDAAAMLRHPALAQALDQTLADGGPHGAEVMLPVPLPRELSVRVIGLDPPLSDGGRLLVVLTDRTRERAVERMRVDFVANASHELRTPLASLIGFIETLRGPAEDDRAARARFLGIMAEQAERMRRLIDDLLGLTRIEINEHTPPAGEADIAAIAAAEAEAMAPLLSQRRVQLETSLRPGSVAAPADAEQVAQVVRNLLENAVRYGRESGRIVLSVAPVAPGAMAGATRLPPRHGVLLSLGDDGPGIGREHIPRLTERFYRVDKGRSRHAGGTGLGLAIVKHAVNRHRGQLLIESEEGVGSTFRVWWPAAAKAAGSSAAGGEH